jgi:hypothetical protein
MILEEHMSLKQGPWLAEEIADFFASCPTAEEILSYRPSAKAQKRLSSLLAKEERARLTEDEQEELDVFEHAEALLQLVKARLRARKAHGHE